MKIEKERGKRGALIRKNRNAVTVCVSGLTGIKEIIYNKVSTMNKNITKSK